MHCRCIVVRSINSTRPKVYYCSDNAGRKLRDLDFFKFFTYSLLICDPVKGTMMSLPETQEESRGERDLEV